LEPQVPEERQAFKVLLELKGRPGQLVQPALRVSLACKVQLGQLALQGHKALKESLAPLEPKGCKE